MGTTKGYRFVELLEEFVETKGLIDRNYYQHGWSSNHDEALFARIKQEIADIVDRVAEQNGG